MKSNEDLKFSDHLWNMQQAIKQAEIAEVKGEVPVGAILVDQFGKIISEGYNLKENIFDCTAHAEITTLRKSNEKLQNWRLTGTTLYVTLEPCIMCLSAMIHARIKRVVFGAYDMKAGSIGLGYHFFKDSRLNHQFEVIGGILNFECSKMLSDFFKRRRSEHKFKIKK